jgi:hypothetical protein
MEITQTQLPLEDTARTDDWHLDDRTREIGRRGLADARAALAEATRRAARRDAERLAKAAA